MSKATELTLKRLRETGWTVAIVERWVQAARKRIDAFGLIDILAVRPGAVLGVQSTTGSQHSEHVRKALAEPRLVRVLASGMRFELWSWAKRGGRGRRKLWTLRRDVFVLEGGHARLAGESDAEDGGA